MLPFQSILIPSIGHPRLLAKLLMGGNYAITRVKIGLKMILDETIHFYRRYIKIACCLQSGCPIHVWQEGPKSHCFLDMGTVRPHVWSHVCTWLALLIEKELTTLRMYIVCQ